jgi:hypothetical protein
MSKRSKLTSTEDNLLSAFASLQPMPIVVFNYRVYYDSQTRECLFKTIDSPDGEYISVTRAEYDSIHFCPLFFVSSAGKITPKPVDFTTRKLLQLNTTGVQTVKDNNIFTVDSFYVGQTEYWGPRTTYE